MGVTGVRVSNRKPLTETEVKRSKPGDKPYKLADGRGLHLLITPNGGKLWRWKYRVGGREKLMSFGAYPDVTLATARERHQDARRVLSAGVDPMEQRKEEKTAAKVSAENSFASVAMLWHQHWSEGVTERHAEDKLRRIQANIFPHLGARPIAEIEAPELVAMVKAVEARGARDMAKGALQTTGQIFRYAIAHGYARRNPAAEIKPSDVLKKTVRVNFARVDRKELAELLSAMECYQGTPITRLAMKLLALTFVRTGELIEAKWSEIDFDNARWDIPAERMKMRTPHIVPLSKQAVEVLRLLHRLTGDNKSGLIFPGRDGSRPMSNMTILMALDRMGYKRKHTGHGFRGLASTLLHEQGFDHQHIELQLAHTQRDAVSAAYNHALYLQPRAAMMQAYADFLEQTARGA